MTQVVNPYVAGIPLRGERGFFGRQDILKWVTQELHNPGTNALVLSGQRRIGKTTLLLKLERTLPTEAFLPVYFDLQDQARHPLGQVLAELAYTVTRRVGLEPPNPGSFDDEGHFFQRFFLPHVYQGLNESQRPVILLDEFDVLDQAKRLELRETAATRTLFSFLRSLMTKDPRLAFVFAVGRQAEDLSLDFAATLKASLSREIWTIDMESAKSLVRQAEANGTLRFTDQAVERILNLTSCHPYLTQLLCQRIWEQVYAGNPSEPPQIDISKVETAVSDTLEAGEQGIVWLWEGLSPAEKIYAAALAEVAGEGETISEDQIIQVLATHAARLRTREVELAPRDLVKRRILEQSREWEYRFEVELFRRWVRQRKPLRDVKDELDRVDPLAGEVFNIGQRFFHRGDWKVAIRYFRDTLNANPRHFRARLLLGEALLELSQPDEAMVELERAYELDRNEARLPLARALMAQAKVRKEEGDEDSALAACERALQLSPNEQAAQELKAEIWTRRGTGDVGRDESEAAPIAFQRFDVEQVEEITGSFQLARGPNVITITGPSGAGKSTVVRYLLSHANKSFRPVLIPKYTTRSPHKNDRAEVLCVADIPSECDLIYEYCMARYGLELNTIFAAIAKGQSPIVILNDIRAVEDVRSAFGELVTSAFIFRETPTRYLYRELGAARGVTDEAELDRWFHKAQVLYRVYTENIHLFDHVILNSGTFDNLNSQVRQVVNALNQPSRKKNVASIKRLFIIVGAPGSGKDLLIQAINDLGVQHARIVPKHTSRKRRYDDGNEMICIGDSDYNLDGCDIIYENYGKMYGIESSKIWEGVPGGTFQVVVISDIDAITKLRSIFGEFVALVYVHSETHADEYRYMEAFPGEDTEYVERRATEYQSALDIYLENYSVFDHVLIHSGLPEDLYDQMFRLFRAYERGDL